MAEPVHGPWAHNTLFSLSIHGRYDGQTIVNTWHFEATGAKEVEMANDDLNRIDAAADLLADWNTVCKPFWLSCFGNGYTVETLRCQPLEAPGVKEHRLSPAETSPGGVGSWDSTNQTAEPGSVAGVLRWRTNIASRSHRGRTYLVLTVSNMRDHGSAVQSWVNAIDLFGQAMRDAYGNATLPNNGTFLTIYSKPYDYAAWTYRADGKLYVHEAGPYVGNSTLVTGHHTDPILRNQRRRQRGVGV